ncbi:MAG: hypothetical protein HY958_10790, partial [Bacteroidia bacterium]|nr:hypothetical protein [Bacteroidia bacterium]
MRTQEQNTEPLTFEKVWQMFQETDKKIDRLAKISQESDKKIDKLAKMYGGISKNLGD